MKVSLVGGVSQQAARAMTSSERWQEEYEPSWATQSGNLAVAKDLDLNEPPQLASFIVGRRPCECAKFGKGDRGVWVVGSIFLRNQPRRFLLTVCHPEAGPSHCDKDGG